MRLRTFIDRPILSCVISVLILLVGIISLVNLAMEQYPDIAPPTISVSTTYTGANAETVQKSVGGGYQWSGKHALYDFYFHQYRFRFYYGLFQPGYGPRYGYCKRKEPGIRG